MGKEKGRTEGESEAKTGGAERRQEKGNEERGMG